MYIAPLPGTAVIDLHSHTTASDGVHSPSALVHLAAEAGVDVLSITDHDTTAGLEEAVRAAAELGGGLRIVPGIELSCLWNGKEIHILGHFIDPDHEELARELAVFTAARDGRMVEMIERCRARGLDVSLEEIEARRTGPGSLGGGISPACSSKKAMFAISRALSNNGSARARPPGWAARCRMPGRESP